MKDCCYSIDKFIIDKLADNNWACRTVIRNNDYALPAIDTWFKKDNIVLHHFYQQKSLSLGASFSSLSVLKNDSANIIIEYNGFKVWAHRHYIDSEISTFLPMYSDTLLEKYKEFISLNINNLIVDGGSFYVFPHKIVDLKFPSEI